MQAVTKCAVKAARNTPWHYMFLFPVASWQHINLGCTLSVGLHEEWDMGRGFPLLAFIAGTEWIGVQHTISIQVMVTNLLYLVTSLNRILWYSKSKILHFTKRFHFSNLFSGCHVFKVYFSTKLGPTRNMIYCRRIKFRDYQSLFKLCEEIDSLDVSETILGIYCCLTWWSCNYTLLK